MGKIISLLEVRAQKYGRVKILVGENDEVLENQRLMRAITTYFAPEIVTFPKVKKVNTDLALDVIDELEDADLILLLNEYHYPTWIICTLWMLFMAVEHPIRLMSIIDEDTRIMLQEYNL